MQKKNRENFVIQNLCVTLQPQKALNAATPQGKEFKQCLFSSVGQST